MDDRVLRKSIIDELEFEPAVEASQIGVAAEKGIFSLSGHVASYAEMLAALEAVRRVKGVLAIAEEIEVRTANEKKTGGDEIAKRAADILAWDSVIPADRVRITVRKRWVTLEGEVNWHFQRKAAEHDIRRLHGVVGVVNNIAIKPAVPMGEVKGRIEAALKRHASVEADLIRIEIVDGGRVRLNGRVDNWSERQAVENAAWSVPGVQHVEDNLTVGA